MSDERQSSKVVLDRDDDNIPSLYANSVGMALSLFDFQMIFGEVRGVDVGGEQIITKPLIKVYMSPQHARVLLDVLQTNIARYEKTYGPIGIKAISDSSEP